MKNLLLSLSLLLASCGSVYDPGFIWEHPLDSYTTEADETVCVDITRFQGASVHLVWTGTFTATAYVQASDSGEANAQSISGASVAMGGASGNEVFNITGLYSKELCIFFDYDSGSGEIDAWVTAKGSRP